MRVVEALLAIKSDIYPTTIYFRKTAMWENIAFGKQCLFCYEQMDRAASHFPGFLRSHIAAEQKIINIRACTHPM